MRSAFAGADDPSMPPCGTRITGGMSTLGRAALPVPKSGTMPLASLGTAFGAASSFAVMTSGGGGGVPAAGVIRRGATPVMPMSVFARWFGAGVPEEGVRRRGTMGAGPPEEVMPIRVLALATMLRCAGGYDELTLGGGIVDAFVAGAGVSKAPMIDGSMVASSAAFAAARAFASTRVRCASSTTALAASGSAEASVV